MREERRTVTALFADVVGSTALTDAVDPEDARDLLGGAITLIIGAVELYGGVVKDLAGDGVLALFGAPIAHEDDPERAVRAGLSIATESQTYGAEVERRWAINGFGIRIGIETGVVVLGPVGAGTRVEYGATGGAVNTAARLQSEAERGTVLVGPATRRLVGEAFEWGPARALRLKGKSEVVEASEAIRARRAGGGRATGGRARLTGRRKEMRTLVGLAARLHSRIGGCVSIVGEPGVGKSRLVAELQALVSPPCVWLEGRCASFGESIPYLPLRDLLLEWLGEAPGSPVGAMRSALTSAVASAWDGKEGHEVAASLLGTILGLPPGEHDASIGGLPLDIRQQRTFEALVDLLLRLADPSGAVVVLEDLHWADRTSLQFVERLIHATSESPLLLVLVMRPEAEHPSAHLADIADRILAGKAVRLDLVPFDSRDAGAFLRSLVGDATLPPELETRILTVSEGNPFSLQELTGYLADSGALVRDGDGWRFDHAVAIQVPTSIEKVILSRLDRLREPYREIVDAASVLGRQFDSATLAAVLRPQSSLNQALEDLERLNVLATDRPASPPHWRFTHALIQETAYASLLRRRRQELHLRVAAVIEALDPASLPRRFGLLAHHLRAAGDAERAFPALREASAESRRVFAMQEALAHATSALEVARELGLDGSDPLVRELMIERGQMRAQTGDASAAATDFSAAVSAARIAGDLTTEARALGERGFVTAGTTSYEGALLDLEAAHNLAEQAGDRQEQVKALSRLSIVHLNLLHLDKALDEAERATDIARTIGDERELALAMDARKQAALQLGDLETLERTTNALSRIHRRRGDRWYLQFSLFESYLPGVATGDWELASRRVHAALKINEQVGDRGNKPLFLGALGEVSRGAGDLGAGLRYGRQGTALANELGHGEWISWTEHALGVTLHEMGSAEDAREHLTRAVAAGRNAGARVHLLPAIAALARLEAELGNRASSSHLAQEADGLLRTITVPPGRGWLFGWTAIVDTAEALGILGLEKDVAARLDGLTAAAMAEGWNVAVAGSLLAQGRALASIGATKEAATFLSRALGAAVSPVTSWIAQKALAEVTQSEDHASEARRRARDLALSLEREDREQFLSRVENEAKP